MMVSDPTPVVDATQLAGYFEAEVLVPVVIACIASIGLSALWLAAVMYYLRQQDKDSARPSH